MRVVTNDEQQTHALGVALGQVARPNLVVALIGNLGAGKTRFVKAAAAGLGVPAEQINSPTFVLIHEYEGRLPIYHFDTYRLRDIDEFMELGADEYFTSNGVCFVEWADRVTDALPRDRLEVRITHTGTTQREFEFRAMGSHSQSVLDDLSNLNSLLNFRSSGGSPEIL